MKLLLPEALRTQLRKTYERHRASWLAGQGSWPQCLPVGTATEKEAAQDIASVRCWCESWRGWQGFGQVGWVERQWLRLGTQNLPEQVTWTEPEMVAHDADEGAGWRRARACFETLVATWPALSGSVPVARLCIELAEYESTDFARLIQVLSWLLENPASNLLLRQLPINDVDTKWVENRKGMVAALLRLLRPETALETDFHTLCGLRKAPAQIRVRVLCPILRGKIGGLSDLEVPVEDLVALKWQPETLLIVENLATGLALPELQGTVAVMKLGNAVSLLEPFSWVPQDRVFYWGDLDTHGLAILARARQVFPQLRSVLMDEVTLRAWPQFWTQEKSQASLQALPELTVEERAVYDGLHQNRWGECLRLEQERIPWVIAEQCLREALNGVCFNSSR